MNSNRRFVKISMFSVIIVLLCAILCHSKALNLPEPTNKFYISDFANVLSDETENYILNQSNALNEKTSAQVVVATVNSLENVSIEEYGVSLFRKWGIGNKDKNNGLLILLAPNERKIRIEVGYGLEGKINDAKAGRFINDYAVPYLKNNDWDSGIYGLYTVILSEVYSEYGMEVPESVREVSEKIKDYDQDAMDNMVTIFIVVVVIGFSALLPFIIKKRHHGNNFYDGFGGDFGGGGFSDGGGNFGGFGGGGGSSGGGGASGRF